LLAGLLLLSLAARARQYFSSTSYWYDEAYLLVNIMDRTYAELIGPLRMCVVIPPLYLWLLRFLYEMHGSAEWVMRLPAFAAGVSALVLMIPLARQAIPGRWWMFPVALAAMSRHLVLHSYEVRPYCCDMLLATAILLAAWFCLAPETSVQKRRLCRGCLLALGLLSPWLSFPSPFILAGACAALVCDAWNRRHCGWRYGVMLGGVVLLSAAGLWWVQARHLYYPGLKEHWTELGGFPAASNPGALLGWTIQCLVGIGHYGTTGMGVPLTCMAALGLADLWKRERALGLLLATPVALALLAALAGKYPLADRTVLFLVPCVWLLAAAGACWLGRLLSSGRWIWLPLGLAAVLVGTGMPQIVELIWAEKPKVDFRGAFERVGRDGQKDDLCWVSHPEVHEVYFGKGETDRISSAPPAVVAEQARDRRLWVVAPPSHPAIQYPWNELRACLRAAGMTQSSHCCYRGLEVDLYERLARRKVARFAPITATCPPFVWPSGEVGQGE
jgi:Dolichyl-phosphate-mannose-protein mannosyltransferase